MTASKENNKIIKKLLGGWEYTRRQRYELLGSLNDEDLSFTPKGSEKFLDLQHQFACIGSTQRAYTEMLKMGRFESKYFSMFKSPLKGLRKVSELTKTLRETDKKFKDEILQHFDEEEFDWGDTKTPVWRVVTLLQEHERLHHGQLVSYFTLAGLEFPPNFKKTWQL